MSKQRDPAKERLPSPPPTAAPKPQAAVNAWSLLKRPAEADVTRTKKYHTSTPDECRPRQSEVGDVLQASGCL